MQVQVGDIWRKNGKDYRVQSVNKWLGKDAASLHPVIFTHDQWNSDYRPVPPGMRAKYFSTMVETMQLVERNARYHMNYVCPKSCFCYKNKKVAS